MATTSIGYALGIGSGIDIKTLVERSRRCGEGAQGGADRQARGRPIRRKVSKLAEMSGAIDNFATALSA